MQQMSLTFEPGIGQRYRSLLECVAAGVYQRGLGRVAGDIDEAPSNLSAQLAGEGRKFGVESLEHYIDKTGDVTPIYYLVDKYLRDPSMRQQEAMHRLTEMMEQMQPLLEAAGMVDGKTSRKRR